MKISVLVENTVSKNLAVKNLPLQAEHGLSLFIQTQNKNILFDMGQTNLFSKNANLLGINLQSVDFAILSHGHYDHGGLPSKQNEFYGIEEFINLNKNAPIFINKNAFCQNFNASQKYIGLNQKLLQNKELSSRLVFVQDEHQITPNISLHSCNEYKKSVPTNPYGLMQLENGAFIPDNFNHEHYLLIQEGDKKILISGCSHKGILNIVEWFKPDFLIGGFHFKSINIEETLQKEELIKYAKKLSEYNTKFFTCHCTGTEQFQILKSIMKEKLEYIAIGNQVKF